MIKLLKNYSDVFGSILNDYFSYNDIEDCENNKYNIEVEKNEENVFTKMVYNNVTIFDISYNYEDGMTIKEVFNNDYADELFCSDELENYHSNILDNIDYNIKVSIVLP